jgi:hypothetical protein
MIQQYWIFFLLENKVGQLAVNTQVLFHFICLVAKINKCQEQHMLITLQLKKQGILQLKALQRTNYTLFIRNFPRRIN